METQVSTGYGERYPTEECPEGIFLLIAQLTIGIIIDGAIIGIVYAKMVSSTYLHSKYFSIKSYSNF